tara:strand:- start:1017 stop:1460 length:444 start_codon:yes stop_codon:yes gene_type:complete
MLISISLKPKKKPRIQGAVIPWIDEGGKLKIILVRSSHSGKWGLPKGGVEDHLSKKQSAELEALEEAGLKGVLGKKLDSYKYIKGKTGREQIVHVYPMRVTEILNKYLESEWRERKTFDVKKAINLVNKKQAALIKRLFSQYKAGIL